MIDSLSGFCVEKRSKYLTEVSRVKWEARLNRTLSGSTAYGVEPEEVAPNICRFIPRNSVELLNIYTMVCPACKIKTVMSWKHLTTHHNLEVYDPILLLKELSKIKEDMELETEGGGIDEEVPMWDGFDMERESFSEPERETRCKRLFDAHQRIEQEILIVKKFIKNSKP